MGRAPCPGVASEWLAESYYRQSRSQLPEALAAARKAVEESPAFAFGWERVAELEFGFGRTSAALEALNKSVALAHSNAQADALKGFLLAAQNRIPDAVPCFDQAISLDGALANAWLGRGLCRIKLGQARDGDNDLLVAAALEPQRAVLRSYLGKAFTDAGDDHRADQELELARQLDPNDPTGWLYAALLEQQQNQINAAISDMEAAQTNNDNRMVFRSRLLLDQDRAVTSANLASVYRDAGMTDVSVREAARAVTDDYANDSAHLFLSDSYYNLLDPTQFNLRYDTAWFNELLLANMLAPVGGGRLSQEVSQQDYSKLFEADGLGLASSSDVRTDGMTHQTPPSSARMGTPPMALTWTTTTTTASASTILLTISIWMPRLNSRSRLRTRHRCWSNMRIIIRAITSSTITKPTRCRFTDSTSSSSPNWSAHGIMKWAPGIHTILLLDRLVDDQQFSDKAAPQLLFFRTPRGGPLIQRHLALRRELSGKVSRFTAPN